ncbi:AraC-type DNA-binding protein [Flaviramulus basaltis]|uniref:AraC-type DNA-binding protein n=1 Tax=Flaviramulus basaltis TaxID=369401 RepID=A0A1K2IMI8_9FLAO|nr:AraC family transcriptional regulator [Flaviramulus basaltis]SFZ93466.1 AraC-type DNA-binding protein [Flaviramulus basaltis]
MSRTINREITLLEPDNGFLVINRVKEKFDFPIHFHPEYELNFILNGKGVLRVVGDSVEELSNIDLVLVGSYVKHGWENHNCKNTPIYEMTFQFNDSIFDEKLLSLRMFNEINDMFKRANHGIKFSKETSKKLMPKIITLTKIDTVDEFIKFLNILQEMAVSKSQRLLSSSSSNVDGEYENSIRIKKVYEFIQENFTRKISLSEISELINMSPVSFNRFIKKRTGKTFVEYVNDTRLSFASRWLIETDMSIGEISFKCGYNNITHFNRQFKKAKKSTPSEFREKFERTDAKQ